MTNDESIHHSGGPKGRAITKNMISIRTYVLPETVPKSVSFSKHMLRFVGLKPFSAGPDLIWGVQGTTSLNSADAFASRDAQHLGRRLYQVELMYKPKGLPPAGTSVTEAFAKVSGYLHFARLTSDYRHSLRERMLAWLKNEEDPEFKLLSEMDFEEIVKLRPMMVHKLMAVDTHIDTVIHSVMLTGGVSLRIATVRNKPENVVKVFTRFHAEIVTTV